MKKRPVMMWLLVLMAWAVVTTDIDASNPQQVRRTLFRTLNANGSVHYRCDSFIKDPTMHVLSPRRISRWIMAFREKICPCGKAMAGRKGSNGTAFARREGEISRDGIVGPVLLDRHDLGAKRVSLFFTTFHSVCPSVRPYMLASLLL